MRKKALPVILTQNDLDLSEEVKSMPKLSWEEMKAQADAGKEREKKRIKEATPAVRTYIAKLKSPLAFDDVIEILNGLWYEQITWDMIPAEVLEEFKSTRQGKRIAQVLEKRKQNPDSNS